MTQSWPSRNSQDSRGVCVCVCVSMCIIFFELSKSEQVFFVTVEIMTIRSLPPLGKGSLWKTVCVSLFSGFHSFWQLFLHEQITVSGSEINQQWSSFSWLLPSFLISSLGLYISLPSLIQDLVSNAILLIWMYLHSRVQHTLELLLLYFES